MSSLEEIQFACIGCGSMNPSRAVVCTGCGHRFAGPEVVAPVDFLDLPLRPENPYEAPASRVESRRTIRIGTVLAMIVVIAICLGAWHEHISLGVFAILSLIPPMIWTALASGRRRSEGRPMSFAEHLPRFVMALIVSWLVELAALIAFVTTCIPTGLMSNNINLAIAIGGTVGISCAVWLTSVFVRIALRREAREGEIRYR